MHVRLGVSKRIDAQEHALHDVAMAAPRRRFFEVLAVLALLMLAFMAWVVLGTSWRSIGRLVNEKVVTSRDSVELLWASGWRRENVNIYRCSKTRLCLPVINGPHFRESTVADLASNGVIPHGEMQALIDRYAPNSIDWKAAKMYTGEGDVLLTQITVVVPENGTDAFIYMFVF